MPFPALGGSLSPKAEAQIAALDGISDFQESLIFSWDSTEKRLRQHDKAFLSDFDGAITAIFVPRQFGPLQSGAIMGTAADGLNISGRMGSGENSLHIRNENLDSVMRVPRGTQDAIFANSLTAAGATILNSTLTVAGATILNSMLTVANVTTINSTLTVANKTTIVSSAELLALRAASVNSGIWQGYYTSAGTRRGFFGFAGSSSDKMTWKNETGGDVAMSTSTASWEIDGSTLVWTSPAFFPALTVDPAGSIASVTGVLAATSDIKLKENLIDCSDCLDKLMAVRVVNYNRKDDPDKKKMLGVVAQEIEKIFPGLVGETPDRETVPDPDWSPQATIPEIVGKIEVEPARTEERQVTVEKTVEVTKTVTELVEGRYVQKSVTRSMVREEPVYASFQVFDEKGEPIKGKIHKVPQMETITIPAVMRTEITSAIPGETEADRPTIKRLTGTSTKYVKMSIFVPMLIKALQEMQSKPRRLFGWLRK